MSKNTENTVFVSYCHTDKEWLDRLQVHLRPLERENRITAWSDTRIRAGADWRREIGKALDSAATAILLISADFLASDFISEDELPKLLESAENKGTVILSLIVNHSRFTSTPSLSRYQAINPPDKPLASLDKAEQERVLVELTKAIEYWLKQPPASKGEAVIKTDSGASQAVRSTLPRFALNYKFKHNFLTPDAERVEFVVRISSLEEDFVGINVPAHICLLLDVSGSMSREGKYDSLLRAVPYIVDALSDDDWLSIILFSSESAPVWSQSAKISRERKG